jgi:predicted enzyme related to lactoylglutathione lyase
MRSSVFSFLSILLVTLASATPAAAVMPPLPFELPPLVQPASHEHHPGKIVWTDLVTPDVVAAKKFYGALFGWTFRDISTGERDYAIAYSAGEPIAGIIERPIRPGEQRQPYWLIFISVKDVGRAQQAVLAHGGKVLAPARMYRERGPQAVFADPQGAVFAVLQSKSGDPRDELADPGEWIWSSLLSHDANAEAAFYQALFGYQVFDPRDDDQDAEHLMLADDHYARASCNALPATQMGLHSHWLHFVRVLDAKDAAARVESMGGKVLVAPHEDRHGGMVAVVADPAGAPFGLLEWTQANQQEITK